ncbi:MAG: MarC family protein [Chloroflexi bacterium]|nr:MarC family protein [Chloroflexota bacterium]
MFDLLNSFIQTFVPLFIVIDAVGNLPFVIALSEGMSRHDRRTFVRVAVGTAAAVGLSFLFLGQIILGLMGITEGSFAIAGGLILLVLSVKHMTTGRMVDVIKEEMVAVVPIGTPLTVGPATITTLLLLAHQHALYMVLFSFMLNIVIAWIIFSLSDVIGGFLGHGGLKAVSQVTSLLLAAIGVNMVVRGLGLVGVFNLAPR